MKSRLQGLVLVVFLFLNATTSHTRAAGNPYGRPPALPTPGDALFEAYFRAETEHVEGRSLAGIRTLEQWSSSRERLRGELFEMLGLEPRPTRTELRATVTGKTEHADFTVENLHFQSRPGLYVTANVYVPKKLSAPAPAILYVCGHGPVKTNGVSYGNKVAYQQHGIWFARNGYVCLVMDTVQLGEIEGLHHGTYREGMWWWNSRGYTAAGVEAWNSIRALDYLQSRKDVDGALLGVTGRSGGGAYSWWVTALDDRVRVACPVAGITDLRNHIIDGVVEGHCDCMFMVNTYRWDFAQVAALVAPRPLLLCNTDKDTLFPLEGVIRVHAKTRAIYELYGAPEKLGLMIAEGPHKDTQELQLPVMRWFNKWLKKSMAPVESAAAPLFLPGQLKVFETLPQDEKTSRCFEDFTVLASNDLPFDKARTVSLLRQKTFGGWPEVTGDLAVREVGAIDEDGVRFAIYEFASQPGGQLRCYLAEKSTRSPKAIRLTCLDATQWVRFLELVRSPFGSILASELSSADGVLRDANSGPVVAETGQWMRRVRESGEVHVFFAPRGVGITAMSRDPRHVNQVRRRFMLLGQTLPGMQVWDLRRAVQALRALDGMAALPFHLEASAEMTEVATFAAVFEPGLLDLSLNHPPRPDKETPDFLNWRRIVTPEQLLQLVTSKCRVNISATASAPKE